MKTLEDGGGGGGAFELELIDIDERVFLLVLVRMEGLNGFRGLRRHSVTALRWGGGG